MSDTLERLRRLNKPASSIGGYMIPVYHNDLAALLDIAEAAQGRHLNDDGDVCAGPAMLEVTVRYCAICRSFASLDSTGGAER